MDKNKWRLKYGIHRGTMISRAADYTEFDTRDEAIGSYKERKKFHNEMGYYVWYAIVVSPDGEQEYLDGQGY